MTPILGQHVIRPQTPEARLIAARIASRHKWARRRRRLRLRAALFGRRKHRAAPEPCAVPA